MDVAAGWGGVVLREGLNVGGRMEIMFPYGWITGIEAVLTCGLGLDEILYSISGQDTCKLHSFSMPVYRVAIPGEQRGPMELYNQ